MAYHGEYDHFHVVSICVECAEISILAIARDTKALEEFFDGIESELTNVAATAPFAPKNMEFNVEVVVPNQIVKITPLDGHERAHMVVAIVHKCVDSYDFCYDKQKEASIKKLATEAAMRLFKGMEDRLNSGKIKERSDKQNDKQNDQARRLLESLDLPDDLFKGMN